VFTGSVALIANLRRELSIGNMLLLGVDIGSLSAVHAGGLYLALQAAGPDGPCVVPPAAVMALLPVFLVFWAWQQGAVLGSRSIPSAIYVKLVNAGALRPAAKGDA
jgi:NAD(P)H-quinone oxidoreductase subunit 5